MRRSSSSEAPVTRYGESRNAEASGRTDRTGAGCGIRSWGTGGARALVSESCARSTELSTEAEQRESKCDVSRRSSPGEPSFLSTDSGSGARTCPQFSLRAQLQVVDPALVLSDLAPQLSLELLPLVLAPQFPDLERAHAVGADERDPAGPHPQSDVDLVVGDPAGKLLQERMRREDFDGTGVRLEREQARERAQGNRRRRCGSLPRR